MKSVSVPSTLCPNICIKASKMYRWGFGYLARQMGCVLVQLTQPQVLQDPESPNAAAQRQGLTHTVHVGVFGVQIPYETWT